MNDEQTVDVSETAKGTNNRAPTHLLTDPARIDEAAWSAWRSSNPWVAVDLRGSYLSHANLDGVNLSRCDLSGAKLPRRSMVGTNLSGANLSMADLHDANLEGADLGRSRLRCAKLNGAILVSAGMEQADLTDASLYTANLSHARLCSADLTRAKLAGANFYGATVDGVILDDTELMGAMAMSHPDVCAATVVGSGANWCSALRNQITGAVKIWAYGDVYESVEQCRNLARYFAGLDADECNTWLDLVEQRLFRDQDQFLSTEEIKLIEAAGGSATNPNRSEHRGVVATLPGDVKIHRLIGPSGWAVSRVVCGELEGDPVKTRPEAVEWAIEESARITGPAPADPIEPEVRPRTLFTDVQAERIQAAGGVEVDPTRYFHSAVVASFPGGVSIKGPSNWKWQVAFPNRRYSGLEDFCWVDDLDEAIDTAIDKSAQITGGKAAAVLDPGARP